VLLTWAGAWLAAVDQRTHLGAMNLALNDVQAEMLTRELHRIIQNDRYPLTPRIVTLKEILGQLRPEPVREPPPPRRDYEPPSSGRYKRRG
jgi:hypothetical protein